MVWIRLKLSKKQVAPLVRTGGSCHTGLAAPPHRNIQQEWQQVLSDGKSREHVFNGFADSKEFKKICESYGIK